MGNCVKTKQQELPVITNNRPLPPQKPRSTENPKILIEKASDSVDSKQQEKIFREKFDNEMNEYYKPLPQILALSGTGRKGMAWHEFFEKVLQPKIDLAEYDEFDYLQVKYFHGIKPSEFNQIVQAVKTRLAGRDLLGFTMEQCKFDATPLQEESVGLDSELLLGLCQKAYQLTIYSSKFENQIKSIQEFLISLISTTASLSELTLSSDNLFDVQMQSQLLGAMHENASLLHQLTKLNFYEMSDLPENPDQVSQLVEFLQYAMGLEELGLENCNLGGYELARIGVALQQAKYLNKLKKLNFNTNSFDTEESCKEMAQAVALCPKFQEFQARKTGIVLTVNHRVKVRRTQKIKTVDKSGREILEEHADSAVPICVYTRKFD